MFKKIIEPRIGDTDGLRHINNNQIPIYFEMARNPLFRIFVPNLELTYKKWNLIMVHMDCTYVKQTYFGYDVEVRTYISKIGNTSFTLYQELWQNGELNAKGTATLIYFDFIHQKSMQLTEEIRQQLQEHFITKEELEIKNKKEMAENKNKPIELNYFES